MKPGSPLRGQGGRPRSAAVDPSRADIPDLPEGRSQANQIRLVPQPGYTHWCPDMMQRSDITSAGIPPRAELDKMLASPSSTDVPRLWLAQLSQARACLDAAEFLQDGSQRLCQLIDTACDIEEAAVQALSGDSV